MHEVEAVKDFIESRMDLDNVEFELYLPEEASIDVEESTFSCDIFITEIVFDNLQYNGICLARAINRSVPNCKIIFYADHIPDGWDIYDVEHCNCVMKRNRDIKLVHAVDMAIITEEIYQALPHTAEDKGEFIMLQKWPEYRAELSFPQEEEAMGLIIDAITAIRARRNEMNVAPSKKVHYTIATAHADTFARGIPFFKRLASASDVTVADANIPTPDGSIEVVTHAARVLMPLAELVDFEKELARITKEKANAEKQLAGIENKLSNQGFIAKAPEAVVNGAREDAAKLRALIEKLDASAAAMKK